MADAQEVPDGNTTWIGGQDASRDPDKIGPGNYASGINVMIQEGVLRPRWGFDRLSLNFPDSGITLIDGTFRSYDTLFRTGRFQALIPYSIGNTFYLIVVVSGIIYLINQDTLNVSILSITDGSFLDESQPRLNWSNAGKYLIIFDFPARPVIIEGFTARRADPANFEVPISNIGGYNQNRLFIGNAGNEFTGGDPAGSLATPDAPITFTEVELPASPFFGQIFQLSTNYNNDPISAIAFLQAADTGTGIGGLLVSTRSAVYAYNTTVPRASWLAGQFGTNVLHNVGIGGQRAFTNVNSDIFFMSAEGEIRSFSMSRQEQGTWSKVPISKEVQNWLKFWDTDLASYSALGYFNNKIYATANPYRVRGFARDLTPITDIVFGGLVVLGFDNVSNLGQPGPVAWDGLWTGVRPMDMCTNDSRFFVISKDASQVNNLYEVDKDSTVDYVDGRAKYVRSRVYTRTYSFNSPLVNKNVKSIDFALSQVQGDLVLDVAYRPSHAPNFLHWKTFKHNAPWRDCGIPAGCELNGFAGHSFRELNLGSPETIMECDPVTDETYDTFRKLQLRFDITAKNWQIDEFLVRAILKNQNTTEAVCGEFKDVPLCLECNTDWNLEEDSICQQPQT